MAFTKPSLIPTWTDGNASKLEAPTTAKQELGWVVEKPSHKLFNWLSYYVGLWLQYLDQEVEAVKVVQGIWDAVIDAGGTHSDINEVMADANIQALGRPPRIFHKGPYTATVTQVVDIEGTEIVFGPGGEFAKGASLAVGISIDVPRVRIRNGRFLNFNETGGAAIELTSNADKCFITENSFNNVTKEVDDDNAASDNNVISGNLTE